METQKLCFTQVCKEYTKPLPNNKPNGWGYGHKLTYFILIWSYLSEINALMELFIFYCLITADDKKLCTWVNYISEAAWNYWNKIIIEQVFK